MPKMLIAFRITAVEVGQQVLTSKIALTFYILML